MRGEKVNKSKKYIILVSIIITIFLGVVLIYKIPKKRLNINNYDKYSLTIHINALNNNETKEAKIITVNFDGQKSTISLIPDAIEYNGYLIDNVMYYEKDGKLYKLEVQNKYTDLYNYLKNLKGYDKGKTTDSKEVYYILLNPDMINKILDCLYFGKKNDRPAEARLTIVEKKIRSFNVKLVGIDGYQEIELNFNFNELKDSYNVNVPKTLINESNEIEENPFSIIK